MKRLHLLLATLALLCTTTQAWGQTVIASGTCGAEGDNLTWTLTDDGTLTISGEGKMNNYYSSDNPWYEEKGRIQTVIINDGVTSIGSYAFDGCTKLTTIRLPENLTSIEERAFEGCAGLTSIDLPENLTSIGVGAFVDCTNLASANIPESVVNIGNLAFTRCALTSIHIPESVMSIGFNAFVDTPFYNDKSNWTDDALYIDRCLIKVNEEIVKGAYTIVPGTRLIADNAFQDCWSLTSVNIPDGVTSIGDSFLRNCGSLTSVDIPDGVTSIGNLFLNSCWSLTSVDIPDGVTSIGNNFLNSCWSLTSVDIPNSVTSIGDSFLHSCISLTSVDIPNGVTSIGDYFLASCRNLTSVDIPDGVTSIGDNFLYVCDSLTSVTLPNSVTSIGNNFLNSCWSLTSVDIPNSVTSIGDEFLSQCNKLTSVWIGSGLETISPSEYTDDHILSCTNLEVFVCKSAVAQFPAGLLQGLQKLRRVEGPANLLEYENNEDLQAYTTRLDSVAITGGTVSDKGFAVLRQSADALETLSLKAADNTTLPTLALDGCLQLRNLTLPASLTSTGYGAFKECTALTSVALPASLAEVGDRAFEDCYLLHDIMWNEDLQRIGGRAFYGCNSLPQVTIPEGVEEIGVAAFMGCTYMEEVQLPASLRTIGDNAFAYNTRTRSMTVHAAVPPLVSAHTFYQLEASAPVYVPAESLPTYRATPYWQDLNLQPIGDATGMGDLTLSESVTVVNGEVHLNLPGTFETHVYDLQGRHVLSTTESHFALPQDIYIIKVGNEAVKLPLIP